MLDLLLDLPLEGTLGAGPSNSASDLLLGALVF
jgi:hypothetical protein